jgi:CRP-like cAMP-binding protein
VSLPEDSNRLMRESHWLSLIPEELAGLVVGKCVTRELKKGKALWHFGDEVDGLYFIQSGCIRVETTQSEQGPAMLIIFNQGSWIGEAEIIAGTSRITTMHALRDCSLLFLPRRDLSALLKQFPELWRGLGYIASEHLYVAVAGMSDLVIRSSSHRLAAILLRLCGARVPGFSGSINLELDITQSELAQLCNVSRSVISEHLEELEQRGIVQTGYGRLRILDVEALAAKLGLSPANTAN